jgi:hypothetical protein
LSAPARGSTTHRERHLVTDPERTAQRIGDLRSYMETNVLGPGGFCCPYASECRSSIRAGDRFYEGILSHVGRHFDLTIDGRPLRVVVVGQEPGHKATPEFKAEHVSLDERYRAVHDRTGIGRRYYAEARHRGRNPHMRGTTSALRVLFGKGLGSDWGSEFLLAENGEGFHIFDAFALVNVLLCSAHPPKSAVGTSTEVMRRNCLTHFEATIRILEPTVLILQGQGVQAWVAPAIRSVEEIGPFVTRVSIAGIRMLAARFSHPSAHGALRWGDRLDASYLVDVVDPTLRGIASRAQL